MVPPDLPFYYFDLFDKPNHFATRYSDMLGPRPRIQSAGPKSLSFKPFAKCFSLSMVSSLCQSRRALAELSQSSRRALAELLGSAGISRIFTSYISYDPDRERLLKTIQTEFNRMVPSQGFSWIERLFEFPSLFATDHHWGEKHGSLAFFARFAEPWLPQWEYMDLDENAQGKAKMAETWKPNAIQSEHKQNNQYLQSQDTPSTPEGQYLNVFLIGSDGQQT